MMSDNYSRWEAYDDDQERQLQKLPVCCVCGEYIQQDSAVRIDCLWYCDECLQDMREPTEDE